MKHFTLTLSVFTLFGYAQAQTGQCPSSFGSMKETAIKAALKYQLDPALFLGMITQESQWCITARSEAGAMGLGQLMPGTARDMGVQNPFNATQNLYGSARYLRLMLNRFGNVSLALAAYNSGAETVARAGGIPNIQETQVHVQKVLAYYAYFQKPSITTTATRTAKMPPPPQPIYAGQAPSPQRTVGTPPNSAWSGGAGTGRTNPVSTSTGTTTPTASRTTAPATAAQPIQAKTTNTTPTSPNQQTGQVSAKPTEPTTALSLATTQTSISVPNSVPATSTNQAGITVVKGTANTTSSTQNQSSSRMTVVKAK